MLGALLAPFFLFISIIIKIDKKATICYIIDLTCNNKQPPVIDYRRQPLKGFPSFFLPKQVNYYYPVQ
jgi:hypothetical protein